MVQRLADSAVFMLWLGQELAEETQVEAVGIQGGGGLRTGPPRGQRGSVETFFLQLWETRAFCKAARKSAARDCLKGRKEQGMSQKWSRVPGDSGVRTSGSSQEKSMSRSQLLKSRRGQHVKPKALLNSGGRLRFAGP